MTWTIHADLSRALTIETESAEAFEATLREVLDQSTGRVTFRIDGPRSEALGKAIVALRQETGLDFLVRHPGSETAERAAPLLRPPEYGKLLEEIERFSAFASAAARANLARAQDELTSRFTDPEAARDAERAARSGRQQADARRELESLARRLGPEARQVLDRLRICIRKWPRARRTFQGVIDREHARRGTTILTPTTHDHRVWSLSPAEAWHLYIDETGAEFDADASGALWGVLIPEPLLPTIRKPAASFHAVRAVAPDVDRVLTDLLAHPVGLIGIDAPAIAPISDSARRWLAGITELIDWVIRLLPLPEGDARVRLTIHVEQRAQHVAGEEWEALPTALLAQLSRYHPERADRIDLGRIAVEKKSSEGAWVDAIAHSWGGSGREAQARRRLLQLERFVVAETGFELRRLFDLGLGLGAPPIETWRSLVHAAPAHHEEHLIHHLLDALARHTREHEPLWRRLLDATTLALHEPDASIAALAHETAWLDHALPPKAELNASTRLAWALAVLSEENHTGDTGEDSTLDVIAAHSAALFDEDPVLVALADLTVATAHTNRFCFDSATAALSRWRALPLCVGGLRVRGRITSSLGQHAAFRGDHIAADALFDEALDLFGRMSDPRDAAGDLERTRIYRAINAMDCREIDDARAMALLGEAIGMPPEVAATSGGALEPHRDRYRLHALYRMAASQRPGASPLKTALTQRAAAHAVKSPRVGFPWPIIHLYQALLLGVEGTDAAERARRAVSQIPQPGPTLRLIDWVIEAALLPPGRSSRRDGRSEALRDLRAALPAALPRIRMLEAWLNRAGDDPATLLAQLLPFNFR